MAGGRTTGSSRSIGEDEIYELVSRLEAALPELHRKSTNRGTASGVLKETCRYIKKLRREVGDLSRRLCRVLETMDPESTEAEIIRNLLS